MSTIKVSNIDPRTAGGVVNVNSIAMPSAGNLANRNKIINGDMRIAQRGSGAATIDNTFPVDRWKQAFTTAGAVSFQRQTSSVPTGFNYAIKGTVTTADNSIGSGDFWVVSQLIEGYHTADLLFGTANAKSVTLGFWVRASVTGTYCISLCNNDSNRSFVSEYTITAQNTWEYKTITVPGDVAGTWNVANATGIRVRFALTSGTGFQAGAGSWVAANSFATSNQTQLLETLNATFYVTGVQFEAGVQATPFEYRNYGDELARCQRYFMWSDNGQGGCYEIGSCINSERIMGPVKFMVPMRTTPTVIIYSNDLTAGKVNLYNNATVNLGSGFIAASVRAAGYRFVTNGSGLSVGSFYSWEWQADAELI